MTALALDKRRAALVVLVPAALLLGLTTRTWASGESGDVLSQAVTDVSGGAAAPGVVGLCAVCVVALLGLMTGGRVIRAVSAFVIVLASLGAAVMTVLVALRPVATVADAVARELARTTAPAATGSSTAWVWLAVAASVLLAVGAAWPRPPAAPGPGCRVATSALTRPRAALGERSARRGTS